jgi:pantothenate kinase
MEYQELVDIIWNKLKCINGTSRILVAISGVPGSGKSTLAKKLSKEFSNSAILPMDGFHLYKKELNTPELVKRRGAPWTFDARSFVDCVAKLKKQDEVIAPSFDHSIGDPVPNDIKITREIKAVFVEGNYVLYNDKPWSEVHELFNVKIFVKCDLAVTQQRLIKRHLAAGISKSEEEAKERVSSNDYLNSLLIIEQMQKYDDLLSIDSNK